VSASVLPRGSLDHDSGHAISWKATLPAELVDTKRCASPASEQQPTRCGPGAGLLLRTSLAFPNQVIRLDEALANSMPGNAPTPIEFLHRHPSRTGPVLSFKRVSILDRSGSYSAVRFGRVARQFHPSPAHIRHDNQVVAPRSMTSTQDRNAFFLQKVVVRGRSGRAPAGSRPEVHTSTTQVNLAHLQATKVWSVDFA
jgi:hypothetical protein